MAWSSGLRIHRAWTDSQFSRITTAEQHRKSFRRLLNAALHDMEFAFDGTGPQTFSQLSDSGWVFRCVVHTVGKKGLALEKGRRMTDVLDKSLDFRPL